MLRSVVQTLTPPQIPRVGQGAERFPDRSYAQKGVYSFEAPIYYPRAGTCRSLSRLICHAPAAFVIVVVGLFPKKKPTKPVFVMAQSNFTQCTSACSCLRHVPAQRYQKQHCRSAAKVRDKIQGPGSRSMGPGWTGLDCPPTF